MAYNYEKILAPFCRDDAKQKIVNINKWSKPEFEMLQNLNWIWTQKIDGTNLNIVWDGERIYYVGHTDKTQWNDRSKQLIESTFCTPEAETIFEELYGSQPVTVSMELVGKDFNQNYGHPDGYFYLYDIRNGDTGKYWNREAVESFLKAFDPNKENMDIVQVLFEGSIKDAVQFVRLANDTWNKDFKTSWFTRNEVSWRVENPLGKYPIEGIVGRLPIELYNAKGERLITKVKCRDYPSLEEHID